MLHEAMGACFKIDKHYDHEIRYEDFMMSPDATQKVIAVKYPWLEQIHRFSEYHEYAQVLESVEPDFSRSRYPEQLYFWTRFSQYINALRKVAAHPRKRR